MYCITTVSYTHLDVYKRQEVYSDFEVMNKKCTDIEQLKNEIDEMFDEIVELC